MTRSTVSRLVDELLQGGLLEELDPHEGRRGRPAVPLTPARSGLVAIGLEANVERMVATAVSVSGDVLAQDTREVDVAAMNPAEALASLGALAEGVAGSLPDGARIVGMHLAVPGLVDRHGEVILRAPNLGWDGVRPADHLAGVIGDLPFRVGNDIDSSALTVLREHADASSFLYITGEVGIGSAVALRGQLTVGVSGWASELGHVCVDPGGQPCGCGSEGCLETVVGRRAMLGAAGAGTVEELRALLESGDAGAAAVVERAAGALGIAIGAALNLLDVEWVILGGHLAEVEPWLRDPLLADLQRRVLGPCTPGSRAPPSPRRPARCHRFGACRDVATDPRPSGLARRRLSSLHLHMRPDLRSGRRSGRMCR